MSIVWTAGRQLFLWGALGLLLGFLLVVNNIDKNACIGTAMHFSQSCLWLLFVFRGLFVHPILAALEMKSAGIAPGVAQGRSCFETLRAGRVRDKTDCYACHT